MDIIKFHVYGRKCLSDNWSPSKLQSLYKLYYIYSGSAYFGDYRLEPGHLYIFQDFDRREWRLGEKFDHLYFDFFIQPPLNITRVIDIDLSDKPAIKAVCDAASAVFTGYQRPDIVEPAKSLLQTILLLCDKIVPLRKTGDNRIDSSIEYICANPDCNINVGELSSLAHLDKYYFIKLFHQKTGKTPYRYASDLRLNRSALLLSDGVPVSEVAASAGYQSDAAFSGAFKKRFGVTPSSIRRIR